MCRQIISRFLCSYVVSHVLLDAKTHLFAIVLLDIVAREDSSLASLDILALAPAIVTPLCHCVKLSSSQRELILLNSCVLKYCSEHL